MLISFSGLDGAGKSTLIAWTRQRLETRGISVAVFHMNDHVGLYAWARMLRDAALRSLRRSGVGAPDAGTGPAGRTVASATGALTAHSAPVDARPVPRWRHAMKRAWDAVVWSPLLRGALYPLDLAIFMLYRLWFEGVRGRVLIMDRYFYDTLVDLSAGRSPHLARALQRLTPTPTLAVLLDITPAESFARKGEYSVPYLERRHTAYHRVLPRVRSRLVVHNDERSATERVLATALEPLIARVTERRYARMQRTAGAHAGAEAAATWILRALIADAPPPAEVQWPLVTSIAARNGVLLRLDAVLAAASTGRPPVFLAAVAAERVRAASVLAAIARIEHALYPSGIDVVHPRAFMHLPDVGSDIDVLVPARDAPAAAAVLMRELHAVPQHAGVRHRIEGSMPFRIDGCPAVLDLHRGRLGPAGEQAVFARHLLRAAVSQQVGPVRQRTASAADQLVLLGQERVFGRRTLRLSDIVCTTRLLRDVRIDWPHVLDAARRTGSFGGLCCYLAYVEQIHLAISGVPLLPAHVRSELRLDGWGRVVFRGSHYAFPALRVGARLAHERLAAALRTRSWRSAARVGLLPVVACAAVANRLRGPARPVLALTSHRYPE